MDDVAILISGSEILDGRVADTNSNYLLTRLSDLGYSVTTVAATDDDEANLTRIFKFLLSQAAVVIWSGGMGPTTDDRTRDVVAEFFKKKLFRDSVVVSDLTEFFKKRGRTLTDNNLRQADFPEHSEIVPNPAGTAPGFWLSAETGFGNRSVVCLPGVPRELRAMCEATVFARIGKALGTRAAKPTFGCKVFGYPESEVGARLEKALSSASCEVSYRAAFPDIHLKIKAVKEGDLDFIRDATIQALGIEQIFTYDLNRSYEQVLHDLLIAKPATVVVAESCTGGLIGAALTSVPGSSKYFLGGAQVYSNKVKSHLIDVPQDLIQAHGAVSEEVAISMAKKVREKLGATIGLSATGIAGPDGGSVTQPVGTVWLGLAAEGFSTAVKMFLPSTRDRVRIYAARHSLELLRRHLLHYPLEITYPPISAFAKVPGS